MDPGRVGIIITDEQGKPAQEELLKRVKDAVKEEGDGIAPIGHKPEVKTVSEKVINVSATLKLRESAQFELIKPKVEDTAYNLYQGTDPALNDAWKAGEVVTINFDKTSRRRWASAGGGAPRPLPAQVSNMQASTPEGGTPSIVFTWTNPSDENFAGMVLIVKEGSAPNSVTDGVQVYKGTGAQGIVIIRDARA